RREHARRTAVPHRGIPFVAGGEDLATIRAECGLVDDPFDARLHTLAGADLLPGKRLPNAELSAGCIRGRGNDPSSILIERHVQNKTAMLEHTVEFAGVEVPYLRCLVHAASNQPLLVG